MPSSANITARVIFGMLLIGALAAFGWTLAVYIKRIIKGREEEAIPNPFARLFDLRSWWDVILYWGLQWKVKEKPGEGYEHVHPSYHHLAIFWGFLVITVGTTEYLVQGVWPAFSYERFVGLQAALAFKYLLDVTNIAVIVVIGYSFFRRIVLRPRLIPMNLDAGLILGMILLLCVTHFLAHSAHYAAALKLGHTVTATIFIKGFAGLYAGGSVAYLHHHAAVNCWAHVIIVLFFLNYIPYSKHVHLVGALPNIFFRSRDQKGIMPKLNLEDDEDEDEDEDAEMGWGVTKYEQFSWKSILDNYACTECARCTNYCPAYNTDKPLSPMKLVHDIRYQSRDRGDLLSALAAAQATKDNQEAAAIEEKLEALKPLVAEGADDDASLGYVGTETLWSCTTCGACQEHCPVFIEHPMKILEMRTNLVLEQESMPQELATAFKGIERNMNPWGIGMDQRLDWADEDTPLLDEDDPIEFEYLLFVGCAGSFDNRCQKQTHALLKVMRAAGIKVAVAPEEVCCGDPARRPGNEFIFQMMAEQNIETFNDYGVKKIVTFCPHCYHTLKNEYPQFGGNYEVVHHATLIAELLAEGRLKLRSGDRQTVTYHDSCYLGRWNHIYEEPRDVVRAIPGARLVELERNESHAFCCGAGGGRFWMEEETPRVNENRAKEISDRLPSAGGVVALNCPFCTTMITDGLKAIEVKRGDEVGDRSEDVKVLDIAEMVAAALPDEASDDA